MEFVSIEKLVEKYLNATTTLQEEAILKKYFTEGYVAKHLQEYEHLFNYFAIAKDETYTKKLILELKVPKKRNFKWFAASVAILLCVFVGKQQYDYNVQRKKVEKIYAQVSKGLELLATNLKKGEQTVAILYTYENTLNKILKYQSNKN